MDKPAVYRIRVRGVVPESWVERLGGMHIVSATSAVTTLEGQVPDQAALKGVLDTVYDLHLLLLEVTCRVKMRPGPRECIILKREKQENIEKNPLGTK